jgi:hypothetical protein
MTYTNGIAPIVTVYGPGNLHHLSYASNGAIPNVVGKITTTAAAENRTNFLLGFSYTFTGYAFYWDGAGPAFWRVAGSPFKEPVGTSWTDATGVPWGNEVVLSHATEYCSHLVPPLCLPSFSVLRSERSPAIFGVVTQLSTVLKRIELPRLGLGSAQLGQGAELMVSPVEHVR